MKKPLIAAIAAIVLVTGCAKVRDSRINPFNWFGSSRSEATTLAPKEGYAESTDRRLLVDDVISLRIDRTPEGAIITAVGLPPTQGFWNTALTPLDPNERAENGVLSYEFRIARPYTQQPVGTQASREVSVAHFVSNIKLQNVRQITVIGQRTKRSSRR